MSAPHDAWGDRAVDAVDLAVVTAPHQPSFHYIGSELLGAHLDVHKTLPGAGDSCI